jgi:hypothetical protein
VAEEALEREAIRREWEKHLLSIKKGNNC